MKIKDICTSVTDGSHNPPLGIEKSEYMMLSSKNIFDDEITFDEPRFLTERDFEKEHRRTKIAVGDVLLTIVGTVGRIAVVDEDMPTFALQRSVAVLHPKNDVCLPRFLMYALRGKRTYIENRAKGVAQKGIYLKEVSDIDIHIPDISNQEIIINKLDKVNAIIKLRQKELLVLDNFIKARFVEMFGDPILNPNGYLKEKIEKHIDLLTGYPFKSEQYIEEGINICGGLIIMPQKIKWNECVHWSSVEGFEDYLLNENDIVMALDRPWISEGFKMAKVDAEHLPALLIQRTARIRAIDMNQDYLYYCFINGGFDKHSNVTGSLVPHISAKDISSFEIMIPPTELQKQFADFVHQVDKSKFAVQKTLEQTQTLFDSLMQKYFG